MNKDWLTRRNEPNVIETAELSFIVDSATCFQSLSYVRLKNYVRLATESAIFCLKAFVIDSVMQIENHILFSHDRKR